MERDLTGWEKLLESPEAVAVCRHAYREALWSTCVFGWRPRLRVVPLVVELALSPEWKLPHE